MSEGSSSFPYGKMTNEEASEFVRLAREGHFDDDTTDQEMHQVATHVGRAFLSFLFEALGKLGILESLATSGPRYGIPFLHSGEDVRSEAFLQKMWNERAKDWAIVESPHTYAVTMATFMRFLRFNEVTGKETIVSLGAGPGLYEAYLSLMFKANPFPYQATIYTVDSAKQMTLRSKEIIKKMGITGVKPLTASMTALPFPDGTIDQIICNNALQWVPDWKKAVVEMSRIINPKSLGCIYIIINNHPMRLRLDSDEVVVTDFTREDLLDELERNRFRIDRYRTIMGQAGSGQFGGAVNRTFIAAQYQAQGELRSWREVNPGIAFKKFNFAQ